ncbi:MAG TPA: TonB-dependent receptor, partial [Acidimicrobiales bacterium]|nr:TonB-dependent receptor [Acidimicrobiales bacterium]
MRTQERSMLGTLPRALAAALVLGFAAPALGALVTGNVEGRVTDETTGKPLPGVTVSVSGPALQGEQTEFTDKTGHYLITELPPGEYVVRFYYGNVEVERPRVVVDTDRTLSVSVALPAQRVRTQTIVISERAPSVDVATTQLQTLVTDDLVRNVPLRSRTVDSTLTLAPGSAADPIGASFNGATGLENNYLLDGLNTTNVTHGLIGNHLSVEFVKQTELITGGYNAEYGRALGGVVNVVTKQGSDEFHGGVWFQYAPFELDPMKVARAGEAIASVPRGGPTGYAYGSLEN